MKNILFIAMAMLSLALTTMLTLPIALLPERIRYKSRLYHFLVYGCAKNIFFWSFLNYKIKGNENIPEAGNPAIFVMNHSSSLDIPVLELLLRSQPRIWITKKDYLKIPVWGFILGRMHVAVERGSLSSAKSAVISVVKIAKEYGLHVALFPEGHRFTDGKVHTFHSGFAVIAEKLDIPVIPIAISGLNNVLPAKSFHLDGCVQSVKISIGKPISCKDFQTRQDFVNYTHDWFESELEQLSTK